jgi:hypothetical protein
MQDQDQNYPEPICHLFILSFLTSYNKDFRLKQNCVFYLNPLSVAKMCVNSAPKATRKIFPTPTINTHSTAESNSVTKNQKDYNYSHNKIM